MPKVHGKRIRVDSSIRSYWPTSVRRGFESLREIPWLSLTAISTLFGVLILFLYFRSIDYFPSDFSSLVGLGAATAISTLYFVATMAIGLFAPAAIFQQYSTDEKAASSLELTQSFTARRLVFLQLGGVGSIFLYLAFLRYRDCDESLVWYSFVAIPLVLAGGHSLLRVMLYPGDIKSRVARGAIAVLIAFMALVPFLMLTPFERLFSSMSMDSSIALLTLWALAILVNAAAARLPFIAISIVGLSLAAFMYVALPMLADRPSFFPTMVATFLGVRSNEVQTFRVPAKTCELINGVRGTKYGSDAATCGEGTWSEVKVHVLSNVGERWLVEISPNAGMGESGASPIRLTIPREGVQIVTTTGRERLERKTSACAQP